MLETSASTRLSNGCDASNQLCPECSGDALAAGRVAAGWADATGTMPARSTTIHALKELIRMTQLLYAINESSGSSLLPAANAQTAPF
jgi:hypothetical protein